MNPHLFWIPLVIVVGICFVVYMTRRNREYRRTHGGKSPPTDDLTGTEDRDELK